MSKKVDEYKGFEIWLYEKGEKGPKAVYAVTGTDGSPVIPGYRKTEKSAKKLIDKILKDGPVQIETYLEIPIFFDFKTKRYHASMPYGDTTIEKKSRNKDKVTEWINQNTI